MLLERVFLIRSVWSLSAIVTLEHAGMAAMSYKNRVQCQPETGLILMLRGTEHKRVFICFIPELQQHLERRTGLEG